MRTCIAFIAATALLTGCGGDDKKDEQSTTVRCLFVNDVCFQITAVMSSAQQTTVSTNCTENQGQYAVGTCSTTGAVPGYCRYTGDAVSDLTGVALSGATMNEYYYTAGDWSGPSAQADCAAPPAGTWVP